MYLEYFSLERHPFRITPDPSLFFAGGTHGRGMVLDALVYGITSGEGILKVVGEVGSGKTMLCRMLEEKLPPSVEIVYLANPNLSARDIVYAIAFELKLAVDAATDRLVVMHKLQHYLLQRHSEGASVVVFIEEAQGVPLETLEEIRLLSNLETHRHKLMQIVLFGQPELDRKLENKAIRQLRERITHSFNLEPLDTDEIREYLHFRLRAAGCPWPQLFSPRAEKILAAASVGLTRRINILADKSLLAAYADPITRSSGERGARDIQPQVLPKHVRSAIADSNYRRFRWPGFVAYAGYGIALVAVSVLGLVLATQDRETKDVPEFLPVHDVATIEETTAQGTAAQGTAAQQMATPLPAQQEAPRFGSEGDTVGGVGGISGSSASQPMAGLPVAADSATRKVAATTEQLQASTLTAIAALSPAAASELAESGSNITVDGAGPGPEAVSTMLAVAAAPHDAESQNAVLSELLPASARNGQLPVLPSSSSYSSSQSAPSSLSSSFSSSAGSLADQEHAATLPATVAGLASSASLPVTTGLAALRREPTTEWLAGLPQKSGYTVQLFSIPTQQPQRLEQFLEFLATSDLLDRSYLCVVAAGSRRPQQWLVMHDEFARLSEARQFIEELPAYLGQHQPYALNLDDVACLQ